MAVLAAFLIMIIHAIVLAIVVTALIIGAIVVIYLVIGCLIDLIKDHEMEDDE